MCGKVVNTRYSGGSVSEMSRVRDDEQLRIASEIHDRDIPKQLDINKNSVEIHVVVEQQPEVIQAKFSDLVRVRVTEASSAKDGFIGDDSFNVSFFGKTARQFAEMVDKGDEVAIIGEYKTRVWENQDGVPIQITDFQGKKFLPYLKDKAGRPSKTKSSGK